MTCMHLWFLSSDKGAGKDEGKDPLGGCHSQQASTSVQVGVTCKTYTSVISIGTVTFPRYY